MSQLSDKIIPDVCSRGTIISVLRGTIILQFNNPVRNIESIWVKAHISSFLSLCRIYWGQQCCSVNGLRWNHNTLTDKDRLCCSVLMDMNQGFHLLPSSFMNVCACALFWYPVHMCVLGVSEGFVLFFFSSFLFLVIFVWDFFFLFSFLTGTTRVCISTYLCQPLNMCIALQVWLLMNFKHSSQPVNLVC